MEEPFQGFRIGERYDLHSEMWPASKGFGTYLGGIQPKGTYPRTEAAVLLATIGMRTRYGNHWDDDVLVFSGEDVRGHGKNANSVDQDPEAGANRVLTHLNELGIAAYCFWKYESEETWEYLGLVTLESWTMTPRNGRMVVEYRLLPTGVADQAGASTLEARINAEVVNLGPPRLTIEGGRTKSRAERAARSRVFGRRVKEAYAGRCAVCGSNRVDSQGIAEVDAAHIFPVNLDGSDDLRNGMALCKLHHWAFDGGLYYVDTDLKVQALPPGRGVAGIEEFEGRELSFLPDKTSRPHEMFLRARIELAKRPQAPSRRSRKSVERATRQRSSAEGSGQDLGKGKTTDQSIRL